MGAEPCRLGSLSSGSLRLSETQPNRDTARCRHLRSPPRCHRESGLGTRCLSDDVWDTDRFFLLHASPWMAAAVGALHVHGEWWGL